MSGNRSTIGRKHCQKGIQRECRRGNDETGKARVTEGSGGEWGEDWTKHCKKKKKKRDKKE